MSERHASHDWFDIDEVDRIVSFCNLCEICACHCPELASQPCPALPVTAEDEGANRD